MRGEEPVAGLILHQLATACPRTGTRPVYSPPGADYTLHEPVADGWTDDSNRTGYGRGSAGPAPAPHVSCRSTWRPAVPRRGESGYGYGGTRPDTARARPDAGPHAARSTAAATRWARPRTTTRGAARAALGPHQVGSADHARRVLLVWLVGTYFWADSKLNREVDLSKVEDRPGGGERHQLPDRRLRQPEGYVGRGEEEPAHRRAGGDERRTDTMMILHVGDNGNTMISLPRDSYITIPEFTGSVSGKHYPARAARSSTRPTRWRARAAGPYGRAQHRAEDRPLRRDRLRRLREDRGRGRRRRHGHPARHQGRELRRRLGEGQADPER